MTADPSVALKPGDKIELLPTHCCTTVNLHDRYYAGSQRNCRGRLGDRCERKITVTRFGSAYHILLMLSNSAKRPSFFGKTRSL